MREKRVFHLDWRDPLASNLDHVVGPALVPIEAVLVHAVQITGDDPLAAHRLLRTGVLAPVGRGGAVASHLENPGAVVRHDIALVIDPAQVVAWHRLAGGSRPHRACAVGAIDVQHLGRSDAVKNLLTERVFPTPPRLGRQRLGRGDTRADRAQIELPARRIVEDGVEEGRHGEEQRRAQLLDGLENARGRWPGRVQHRRGADRERKRQTVAEPVGMEQHAPKGEIVLANVQDMTRVGLARVRNVVLQMNHALGPSRRSAAVEPERHVVAMRAGGSKVGLLRAEQLGQRHALWDRCPVRHDRD